MAVSTCYYLVLCRPLWFWSDDWAFLLRRGTVTEDIAGADLGLWAPHNEHWSTGPVLVFRALFAVFGLRHPLPYVVPVLLAQAAVVVLMYCLLVRCGLRRWVACAAGTVLAFNGAGAENLLWAFQIGFVGAVALGLLGGWLYDRYDVAGGRLWPTWTGLTVGLTFSSIGVVMVAFVTAYALGRSGIRAALRVASVPTAVFLVWFAAVGRQGLRTTPHLGLTDTLPRLPTSVWTVLTHSWEQLAGIVGAGPVVVLILAATLLLPAPGRARGLAAAGLVAALVSATVIAAARAGFGVEQMKSSRYVYVVVVLMMPLLAVLLDAAADRMGRPRWWAVLLGLVLLGVVVLNGARAAYLFRNQRLAASGTLQDRVLASALLVRQGAPVLYPYVEPEENPDITTDLLGAREVQEQLPDLTPTAQGMLDAAARLQVLVSSEPLELPRPAAVHVDGLVAQATQGCQASAATSASPMIRVDPAPGGAGIRTVGDYTVLYIRLQRGTSVSDVVSWTTPRGVPVHVGTSAQDASLLVTPNRGGVLTICQ